MEGISAMKCILFYVICFVRLFCCTFDPLKCLIGFADLLNVMLLTVVQLAMNLFDLMFIVFYKHDKYEICLMFVNMRFF